MKMTQCQIGKVALIENDIITVDIESGIEIGIEHIYEFQNAAIDLVDAEKKLYSIVTYGAYSMPTKEAREFCSRNKFNDRYILGRAIVVHGLGQMIITRHTIKQRKSNVPTRIFSDSKNAKTWVNHLRSKNNDYQLISD